LTLQKTNKQTNKQIGATCHSLTNFTGDGSTIAAFSHTFRSSVTVARWQKVSYLKRRVLCACVCVKCRISCNRTGTHVVLVA